MLETRKERQPKMLPDDVYEEYQRRSENEDYKVVAEQLFNKERTEQEVIDAAFENGELYLDEDNTYPYDEGMISE